MHCFQLEVFRLSFLIYYSMYCKSGEFHIASHAPSTAAISLSLIQLKEDSSIKQSDPATLYPSRASQGTHVQS